jgi:hypothetical protein
VFAQLRTLLSAHKIWALIAILVLIGLVQFVVLGIGFGSGDSGIDGGPITTAP